MRTPGKTLAMSPASERESGLLAYMNTMNDVRTVTCRYCHREVALNRAGMHLRHCRPNVAVAIQREYTPRLEAAKVAASEGRLGYSEEPAA